MGASVPYYATAEFMAGKRVKVRVSAVTATEAQQAFNDGYWEVIPDEDSNDEFELMTKAIVSDWSPNDN